MLDRSLRRRCLATIENLNIPDPWDFGEFRADLERKRGRAIRLMPPLPAGVDLPCGLCIPAAETDYIFYVGGTTELHREHIALHEIGHLLGGHTGGLPVGDIAQILLPGLDPAVVARVLGRTAYSTKEEQEAEIFASLVLGTVVRRGAQLPRETPAGSSSEAPLEILDRLGRTLERPATYRTAVTHT